MSERSRTFTWHDPMTTANAARNRAGLAWLQAMQRGEIPEPPISDLLDMGLEVVEDGRVVFTLTPAEYHYNPIGVVHGGVAATMLDSAMACAIHTRLGPGIGYTTVELSINFMRPITLETGTIRAIGEVIQVGRRIGLAEGRIEDEGGKLYAFAKTTCIVLDA